ncbi:uncharacterized protein ASCRUDRAFT_97028 [Ascoidea rubescens DSM 1968]|uniref:SPX domain-containing protein n=1 Tax=Ascoidea rubescens DSM 1968 TaxID=1344418 RepID=A0A1D2VPL9_9ASCO|nr:hypothetical protein ASCRUDRAFT_97028 [Ascoidea rubescens DSM 1968]ODV63558.1 hypothetical protein ASCRUDRAFT_97028 [Ascoidea rubescens DSM 1968]
MIIKCSDFVKYQVDEWKFYNLDHVQIKKDINSLISGLKSLKNLYIKNANSILSSPNLPSNSHSKAKSKTHSNFDPDLSFNLVDESLIEPLDLNFSLSKSSSSSTSSSNSSFSFSDNNNRKNTNTPIPNNDPDYDDYYQESIETQLTDLYDSYKSSKNKLIISFLSKNLLKNLVNVNLFINLKTYEFLNLLSLNNNDHNTDHDYNNDNDNENNNNNSNNNNNNNNNNNRRARKNDRTNIISNLFKINQQLINLNNPNNSNNSNNNNNKKLGKDSLNKIIINNNSASDDFHSIIQNYYLNLQNFILFQRNLLNYLIYYLNRRIIKESFSTTIKSSKNNSSVNNIYINLLKDKKNYSSTLLHLNSSNSNKNSLLLSFYERFNLFNFIYKSFLNIDFNSSLINQIFSNSIYKSEFDLFNDFINNFNTNSTSFLIPINFSLNYNYKYPYNNNFNLDLNSNNNSNDNPDHKPDNNLENYLIYHDFLKENHSHSLFLNLFKNSSNFDENLIGKNSLLFSLNLNKYFNILSYITHLIQKNNQIINNFNIYLKNSNSNLYNYNYNYNFQYNYNFSSSYTSSNLDNNNNNNNNNNNKITPLIKIDNKIDYSYPNLLNCITPGLNLSLSIDKLNSVQNFDLYSTISSNKKNNLTFLVHNDYILHLRFLLDDLFNEIKSYPSNLDEFSMKNFNIFLNSLYSNQSTLTDGNNTTNNNPRIGIGEIDDDFLTIKSYFNINQSNHDLFKIFSYHNFSESILISFIGGLKIYGYLYLSNSNISTLISLIMSSNKSQFIDFLHNLSLNDIESKTLEKIFEIYEVNAFNYKIELGFNRKRYISKSLIYNDNSKKSKFSKFWISLDTNIKLLDLNDLNTMKSNILDYYSINRYYPYSLLEIKLDSNLPLPQELDQLINSDYLHKIDSDFNLINYYVSMIKFSNDKQPLERKQIDLRSITVNKLYENKLKKQYEERKLHQAQEKQQKQYLDDKKLSRQEDTTPGYWNEYDEGFEDDNLYYMLNDSDQSSLFLTESRVDFILQLSNSLNKKMNQCFDFITDLFSYKTKSLPENSSLLTRNDFHNYDAFSSNYHNYRQQPAPSLAATNYSSTENIGENDLARFEANDQLVRQSNYDRVVTFLYSTTLALSCLTTGISIGIIFTVVFNREYDHDDSNSPFILAIIFVGLLFSLFLSIISVSLLLVRKVPAPYWHQVVIWCVFLVITSIIIISVTSSI